jgi:hypothetical protein
MAIAVVPGLLVAVILAGRHESVQQLGQISFQSRLKFNRPDRCSASYNEDMCDATTHARLLHDESDILSDIAHASMPTG